MICKNKKASHVGVILSFVIFITFIVFLYSIIEPATKVQRGKQDLVKYLKNELINRFKDNLTTVTISIDSSVSDCIKINSIEGAEGNVIVKNESGKILNSSLDQGINIKRDSCTNLKAYFSKEFPVGEVSCSNPTSLTEGEDYFLGLTRTTKEIFLDKIINLTEFINKSNSNYEKIKKELKIPLGSEFSFIFEGSDKNEIAKTKQKNVSTDVYAEEIPIQYLDSEANINPGFLRIKVW